MRKRVHRPSAFTYLEILAVIGILIILSILIIPRTHRLGHGELRPREACIQMREIMKALELYKGDNGFYPSTEQGLQALVEIPAIEPKPERWKKYIEKVPLDPWKHRFMYQCPGNDHGRSGDTDREKKMGLYGYYDLICYGSDGIEGEDDIVSWNMPDER